MIKEAGKFPNAAPVSLPLLCMHCEQPACVDVCPTGASYKSEEGPVLIDQNKCIGCRACIVACPYDARTSLKDINEYYPGMGKTAYEKAREGEHKEMVTKAFVKRTPLAAIRSMLGVFMKL